MPEPRAGLTMQNTTGSTADRCGCGHREYDHITEDGTCWKCPCQNFEVVE